MKKVLISLALFAPLFLSGQSLPRYDMPGSDSYLYNPASRPGNILCGEGLTVYAGYKYDPSPYYKENPFDLQLDYRFRALEGTVAAGVQYDGHSYYGLHSLYGRYSRSISFSQGSSLSLGAGLAVFFYDVDFTRMRTAMKQDLRVCPVRPDLDFGAEFSTGRFVVGLCLRNALSLPYSYEGYALVRSPRSVLLNCSYDFSCGRKGAITPFIWGGYSLGVIADLGVKYEHDRRWSVSYALRTTEWRNIFCICSKTWDFLSLGASLSVSHFHDNAFFSLVASLNL